MRVTEVLPAGDEAAVAWAVRVLGAGGLVALPTDTVYGVAAHAFLPDAVAGLYVAKGRPATMAIPLLLGKTEDVDRIAVEVPRLARLLMRRFWPGGLTIILRRSSAVPDSVTAGGDTVAVRLPDHAVPRAVAAALGAPLAATSANLSGSPSPVTAGEVMSGLGGRVDLVLDGGACPGGVESTIVDLSGSELRFVRDGAISRRRIEAFTAGLIGSSHSSSLLRQA